MQPQKQPQQPASTFLVKVRTRTVIQRLLTPRHSLCAQSPRYRQSDAKRLLGESASRQPRTDGFQLKVSRATMQRSFPAVKSTWERVLMLQLLR